MYFCCVVLCEKIERRLFFKNKCQASSKSLSKLYEGSHLELDALLAVWEKACEHSSS